MLRGAVGEQVKLKDIAVAQSGLIEITVVGHGKYVVIDGVCLFILPILYIACRIHIAGHQLYGILRADIA